MLVGTHIALLIYSREFTTARELIDAKHSPIPQRARIQKPQQNAAGQKEACAMSMTTGSHGAEINVTPLIDVLLVLLIIFMVILPHHNLGEEADIPKPAPRDVKQPQPENPIVVQLQDHGKGMQPSLRINQETVSWDRLGSRLRTIFKARGDKVAFVKGDPGVEFQYVADVIDITHNAGAERVGLLP